MSRARQTAIGLGLAFSVLAGWIGLHVRGVFFHEWSAADWLLVPALIAVQSWLGAGMFIVAHDAMHGSLAPGRPRLNRTLGALCVALYAGFAYETLAAAHGRHHGAPGTPDDPDFHPERPRAFAPWFVSFFRRYFGLREFFVLAVVMLVYLLAGAHPLNLAVFWGLPALLSAVQLFTFGTYLPHRHDDAPFADEHRARTLDYPWILSLFACFHFGRHHEHHLSPSTPWWRLPSVRAG